MGFFAYSCALSNLAIHEDDEVYWIEINPDCHYWEMHKNHWWYPEMIYEELWRFLEGPKGLFVNPVYSFGAGTYNDSGGIKEKTFDHDTGNFRVFLFLKEAVDHMIPGGLKTIRSVYELFKIVLTCRKRFYTLDELPRRNQHADMEEYRLHKKLLLKQLEMVDKQIGKIEKEQTEWL